MIIAGTGHRPDKLGGYSDDTFIALIRLARGWLHEHRPTKVISSMALGWDQALAHAALEERIYLIAAIPFEGQERRWPTRSQDAYNQLLDQVDETHIVSEIPGTIAMHQRNNWMVDRADQMLALWDGSWGGTFNCVQYAIKRQRPIVNLWSRWQMQNLLN